MKVDFNIVEQIQKFKGEMLKGSNQNDIIIEFKTINDIANYDFKNLHPSLEVRKEKDVLMKMSLYKSKETKKFDCDSSKQAINLYIQAWNSVEKVDFKRIANGSGKNKKKLTGETMNSFATTYKQYKKLTAENLISVRDVEEKIREFACLTHSIGNFMPVANGSFNPRRYQKTKDYWDLTLRDIHLWYTNRSQETALAKILEDSSDWLNIFGENQEGWDKFIEENFLQDFVIKEDDSFGEPIEFWEGHFEGEVLPKSLDDINSFLMFVNIAIQKRGLRIIMKINSKVQKECYELIDQLSINEKFDERVVGGVSNDDKSRVLCF